MSLQKFKDEVSQNLFGMTTSEAIEKSVCIQCQEEAIPKCYSDAGRKEFKISGLCEQCFDSMFE